MSSGESSPSPTDSSSLKATTAETSEVVREEEEEVELDADGQPATSSTAPIIPVGGIFAGTGLDLNTLIQLQTNPALRAFLTGGAPTLADMPHLAISQLFGPPRLVKGKREYPHIEGPDGKKMRLKVYANRFFMTFDKVSSCGTKNFWRCEYKNTCKARMHTDIVSEKILSFIHEHNHKAPTFEEVRLYGINPDFVDRTLVYIVGAPADPNRRRKIRKQVADREAALARMETVKQEEEDEIQQSPNAILASQAIQSASDVPPIPPMVTDAAAAMSSAFSGGTGSSMSSMLLAHMPYIREEGSPTQASPSIQSSSSTAGRSDEIPYVGQGPAKRRASELISSDEDEFRLNPVFDPTFQLAHKLRRLWKGEPARYPRLNPNTTTYFDFFLAKEDGSEEHIYTPIRIQQRDETHLKEALQKYVKTPCIGMLLFGVSPKISVMFSQPMLAEWDNNQYFLLDVSNPSRWRLMYVDDRAT